MLQEAGRDGCKSHDAETGTVVSKKGTLFFSRQKRKNSAHLTASARAEITSLQRARASAQVMRPRMMLTVTLPTVEAAVMVPETRLQCRSCFWPTCFSWGGSRQPSPGPVLEEQSCLPTPPPHSPPITSALTIIDGYSRAYRSHCTPLARAWEQTCILSLPLHLFLLWKNTYNGQGRAILKLQISLDLPFSWFYFTSRLLKCGFKKVTS